MALKALVEGGTDAIQGGEELMERDADPGREEWMGPTANHGWEELMEHDMDFDREELMEHAENPIKIYLIRSKKDLIWPTSCCWEGNQGAGIDGADEQWDSSGDISLLKSVT